MNAIKITVFLHNFQRNVVYPFRNDGSVVEQVDIMQRWVLDKRKEKGTVVNKLWTVQILPLRKKIKERTAIL
jgi:hypothetical protein